jgi:hypothetical protein
MSPYGGIGSGRGQSRTTSNENPPIDCYCYNLIGKAISLRGSDPQIEFAAALITVRVPGKDHQEHVNKALAGAKSDPLLAQNLGSQFLGDEKQTVAQALTGTKTF